MTASRWRLVGRIAIGAALFASTAAAAQLRQEERTPEPMLRQIAALIDRGDVDGAARLIGPGLEAHPADAVLHNLAGVVAAQRGAFESAETHFRKSIQIAPRSRAAYENLARLYQERAGGDSAMRAKALDVYARLLDVEPGHIEAAYQSGFLLALERRFSASRAMLERLPEEIQRRPQALAVRAIDLIAVGETVNGRRAVEALAAHPELTDADVVAVLAVLPEDRAHELVPVLEALERRGLASAGTLEALAAIHRRASRFADARRVLERIVAVEGVTVPLLMELARTAVKMADHHGALEYLARARSIEPANPSVHFFFGMVCVEQDLVREAYDSLKRAVELDPENPLVNYAMGAVATHRHEPSESLPYFQKYIRLRPDDPRGHFALGAAFFYSHQFPAARASLARAAGAAETATGAHYFLGRIARESNDLATARREIERALELNADVADAWAELGLIQTRSGEYEQAEHSLAKALAIDPNHYAASFNLATLYARTKDPRRDEQKARLARLIEKREARAQQFLRIIKVVP